MDWLLQFKICGYGKWTGEFNGPNETLGWTILKVGDWNNTCFAITVHPLAQYPFGFFTGCACGTRMIHLKLFWVRFQLYTLTKWKRNSLRELRNRETQRTQRNDRPKQ